MEAATKRRNNGVEEDPAEARAKRPRAEEVDDADVEAFFAILQRIRDAERCSGGFARFDGNGNGTLTEVGEDGAQKARRAWRRWQPAFKWEDFEEPPPPAAAVEEVGVKSNGDRRRRGRSEAEERTAGFPDLNAEPEAGGGDDTTAD